MWRLKTTISYSLSWFCGLTGLSWVVLQDLSGGCSQMVTGARVTKSSSDWLAKLLLPVAPPRSLGCLCVGSGLSQTASGCFWVGLGSCPELSLSVLPHCIRVVTGKPTHSQSGAWGWGMEPPPPPSQQRRNEVISEKH